MTDTTADRKGPRWTPRLIFQERIEYSWGTSWYTRHWVDAATVILVIGGILAAIFGSVLLMARTACGNSAEVLGTEYRWRVLGGCYLQVEDGRFVPSDNYRVNENL